MKCPFCGKENTRVIDSRPADDNSSIRRRRQCDECTKRFTTYEKVEAIPFVVIQTDDNKTPYERANVEAGVCRSCHQRASLTRGREVHSSLRIVRSPFDPHIASFLFQIHFSFLYLVYRVPALWTPGLNLYNIL